MLNWKKLITRSHILFLAQNVVYVLWFVGSARTSVSFEPLTTPSAVIFSGSSYSYSARNLNGLSRSEWGQQDEVMNRHSLTWSRLKLRIKISCSSIVSTLWASKMTDWLDPYLPRSTYSRYHSASTLGFLCYLSNEHMANIVSPLLWKLLCSVIQKRGSGGLRWWWASSCRLVIGQCVTLGCPGAQNREVSRGRGQWRTTQAKHRNCSFHITYSSVLCVCVVVFLLLLVFFYI